MKKSGKVGFGLKLFLCLCPFFLFAGVPSLQLNEESTQTASGAYLGQAPPGMEPVVFAPGLLTTPADEILTAVLKDGKEIWYTIQVQHNVFEHKVIKMVDGQWQTPIRLDLVDRFGAVDLRVTHDGKRIYFSSRMSRSGGREQEDDWDIWYIDRRDDTWSAPVQLGSAVNSGADELHPCVTASGNLYFTSTREEGQGRRDVYCARWDGDGFVKAVNLGEAVNTPATEWEAFVANDESYLVLSSNYGSADRNSFDLFISVKNASNAWTPLRRMGPEINSANTEMHWLETPDGRYAFFTSCRIYPDAAERGYGNGMGDIYWVDAGIVESYR
jgi:hypothetical protein